MKPLVAADVVAPMRFVREGVHAKTQELEYDEGLLHSRAKVAFGAYSFYFFCLLLHPTVVLPPVPPCVGFAGWALRHGREYNRSAIYLVVTRLSLPDFQRNLQPLRRIVPIDDLEKIVHELRPAVAVFQIVGMFPNINHQ